jgi:hypothetical protein
MNKLKIIFSLIVMLIPLIAYSQDKTIFFAEDFNDLSNWKPLYFPKIKKHTIYSIEDDGKGRYLKAESEASASALIYKEEFNVYEFPNIRWRWKIENIYKKGDARSKEGDDYPIRVYVAFKYDPANASFSEKIKYNVAKLLYGEYPPHSSLNYIWSSKEERDKIVVSPYTNRSMMIVLQKGKANAGKWENEDVNIIKDYNSAFGKDPPHTATIAIMNDSDNTGENGISYLDNLEVYR